MEEEPRYLEQTFLPMAMTVGELRQQIQGLPDDMEFGFLNQPRQQLTVRVYSDGYKCLVFNGTEDEITPTEPLRLNGQELEQIIELVEICYCKEYENLHDKLLRKAKEIAQNIDSKL